MDSEERRHAYGGTDRAGGTTERPPGSHGQDSLTIGELARESGVTLRALRFYQSKGLLAPRRNGSARLFSSEDRDRLALILQGKRLGFTLTEIREMLSARERGCAKALPIGRRKCVEQINLLERQRRDIDGALAELRQIYTKMFIASELSPPGEASVSRKA
jgi:DNA-binding transcriptional MerR regulator